MTEEIFEVYWKGPFTLKNLSKKQKNLHGDSDCYVLYQVYGAHPLYGNNVLLYIGKTLRGAEKRLKEHQNWVEDDQFGEAKVYIASLGKFENWEKSSDIEVFEKLSDEIVSKIESLLIYTHQPAYNTMNKNTADKSFNIRIFNTGVYGSLLPEISSLYQDISEKH